MKSKAIFLALLAFAFGAQARLVTSSQAAGAARAWARAGASLGARLGTSVTDTEELVVTNDVSVYAVRLGEGGVVFMSSDTEVEPIVAFTSRSDIDLSAESPLVRLLRLDAVARRRLAQTGVPSSQTALASATAVGGSSASVRKWESLLAAAPSAMTSAPGAGTSANSAKPLSSVNDVRVSPLVKSEWSQTEGGGGYCWNYYTPNHLPCGCTATASAQIMRYFKWPRAAMVSTTYDCMLEGKPVQYATKGGTYDWDSLPLVLTGSVSEDTRKALGKLTYDVGVTLETSYSEASGGSASPTRPAEMFRIFKYADARAFWDGTSYYTGRGGLHVLSLRQRIIYANLDAGRPVQLAIYGYKKGHLYDGDYWAGHSVVGDGYGFNTVGDVETAYVHINMGWGGLDDMWYNIPEVDAANSGAHVGDSGYDFLYMGGAIFNISPEESGKEILSGRVTGDDGDAVVGAQVTASVDGAAVGTVTTDANGIYAFTLAGGVTYDVSAASADGRLVRELDAPVFLRKTTCDSSYVVSDSAKVGNSWGNDLTLAPVAVRIVVGTVTNTYSRLDKALVGARAIYAADPTKPVNVEVIDATELRETATVDFPCELSSADGEAFGVIRSGEARFVIAAGGRLSLSNLTFAESGALLAEVAAGGNLRLGQGVTPGVMADAVAFRTADADGFTLAGELQKGLTVDCAGARAVGAAFGRVEDLTEEAAAASAAMIANAADAYGEIRGVVQGGDLLWGEIPVPLDVAVGYYVGADGKTTNTAARIDRLLPKFMDALSDGTVEAGRTLTILRSGALTCRLTGGTDFTLRGVGGAVISNGVGETMSEAGFVITNGTMTVRDLTFDGFSGVQFLVVNGAGAGFVLGSGAKLRNIERTGNSAEASNQGPIAVQRGFLRIEGGEISNCRAAATNGGGVCLCGSDCRLEMSGGVITNCTAGGLGGGVYAGQYSVVRLSGKVRVSGNSSGKGVDNLYLGSGASLAVTGVMAGGEVGVRSAVAAVNKVGGVFATGDEQVLESSVGSFRSDIVSDYVAIAGSSQLKWATAPSVPAHQPLAPSESGRAAARVIRADGTELWETAQWALESLTNETGTVAVELLKDGYFDADLPIVSKLALRSFGTVRTLSRAPGGRLTVVEGASLTLSDVILRGINAADDEPSRLPLLKSAGGEVTLASGAVIEDVRGTGARDAGAVAVRTDGVFRMQDGAVIRRCTNDYVNVGEGVGVGAGLLVDGGVAYLYGGTITGCSAYKAGGVFIGNEAEVHVANDIRITDNAALSGEGPNLLVSDLSYLYLDGTLTGRIGYAEGVRKPYDVFGEVATGFAGSETDLATSARNFCHDRTHDVGAAVVGDERTLLVWGGEVAPDGVYVGADGGDYRIARGGTPVRVAMPSAAAGLVYDGTAQTGVPAGIGYEVTGNVATNAGGYRARATLRVGYVWDDASSASLDLDWTIARGVYDMSRVRFEDRTFVYDGTVKFIEVLTGQLPDGVAVSYLNNNKTDPGEYVVTARFAGDTANYEPIADRTAMLKIQKPEPTPTPEPGIVTNTPGPIAFKSIARESETEWRLVITNVTPKCEYRLIWTEDLAAGFVSTGAWERAADDAAPEWTTNVLFTAPAPTAIFWKAEAQKTYDKKD